MNDKSKEWLKDQQTDQQTNGMIQIGMTVSTIKCEPTDGRSEQQNGKMISRLMEIYRATWTNRPMDIQ